MTASERPGPRRTSLGAVALRGSMFNSIQWLANKLLTAASMLLLAHWLSPTDFGVASQASAVVQFMSFCLPLTLGDVLLAQPARLDALAPVAARMALRVGLLNWVIIVACIPIFLALYGEFPKITLGLLIAVLAVRPLLEAWQMLPLTRLRASLSYGSIALVEGVAQALSTVLSLGMAAFGAHSASLVVPNLGGVAMRSWWLRRVAGPESSRSDEYARGRDLIRDYLPAASAQYLHKVASTLEIPVLGLICGEVQTGLFAFAAMIAAQANTVIAYQLGLVLQPIFGRLEENSGHRAEGLVRVQRLLGLICVPIALAQALVAEPLFRLLFAPRYLPAMSAFQMISLTQTVLYALGPLLAYLRSQRRFRTLLIWQVAQLTAAVPACVFGARLDGAVGVAVGHGAVWCLALPLLACLCLRGAVSAAASAALWLFVRPLLVAAPCFVLARLLLVRIGHEGGAGDLVAVGLVAPAAVLGSLALAVVIDGDARRLSLRLGSKIGRIGRSPGGAGGL